MTIQSKTVYRFEDLDPQLAEDLQYAQTLIRLAAASADVCPDCRDRLRTERISTLLQDWFDASQLTESLTALRTARIFCQENAQNLRKLDRPRHADLLLALVLQDQADFLETVYARLWQTGLTEAIYEKPD